MCIRDSYEVHELLLGVDVELAVDAVDVALHRVGRYGELALDVGGVAPLRQELQDIGLARGELVELGHGGAAALEELLLGQVGGHDGLRAGEPVRRGAVGGVVLGRGEEQHDHRNEHERHA